MKDIRKIARAISWAEVGEGLTTNGLQASGEEFIASNKAPVLGITGTGGAGKSSVTDEILRRFLNGFKDKKVAVISVDPSKKKTGGALLGDRIRMNSIHCARTCNLAAKVKALSADAIEIPDRRDLIHHTCGCGQRVCHELEFCDVSLYV
jgi:methylmalonyl-CoA mutase